MTLYEKQIEVCLDYYDQALTLLVLEYWER